MKLKNLAIGFIMVALIGLLAACGGNNSDDKEAMNEEAANNVSESGFPIVDEEITLKMFTGKSNLNSDIDWNEGLPVWDEYEDMTNIKLDWVEQVHQDSLEEKRNLAIAGGTMPDVFFASKMPDSDIMKYGDQGVFLALNDLIDDYAPNLRGIMDENPDIERAMTFPDGNIYSMPRITNKDYMTARIGAMPWFDGAILEELDMDVPETTDEFYEFLKEVKDLDPELYPYEGELISHLIAWLQGAFGLTDSNVSVDGDLRFEKTLDEYRQMLEYVHKLYDEELINQNIFTIEFDQYMADVGSGEFGSTVFWQLKDFTDAVGGNALEGPNGDKYYTNAQPPVGSNGEFIITSDNPNPAATVRWMDYFYSEEGVILMKFGIEGESYEEKDGEIDYVDEIRNAEDEGIEISKYTPSVGTVPPGLQIKDFERATEAQEAATNIAPYVPEEKPGFIYKKEESKVIDSVGADIDKYVEEMRDKFIAGEESLDDDNWNKYVETIEKMGLDEFMEVEEAAYDRYKSN